MKIVGIGICGQGESGRYMDKTMKEFQRLCDNVIIATNNATQEDKDLITKYGFEQYEDNREWGKTQPYIKTDLLKKAQKFNPDWILALDMDESFSKDVTRETLENLANTEEIGWYFMVVNLYGDDKHFAHDVGIKRFWNVRFYKNMPELGLEFQEKRLHCGLGPPYAYKFGWYAPYYLLHRGLMKPEDRARRVTRYKQYDPDARFITKEYYKDLERELTPKPFNGKKLLAQLAEDPACKPRKTPKPYLSQEEKIEPKVGGTTLITKTDGLIRI